MAGSFDFCLTNPPFGTRTIWAGSLDVMNHYDLGHKWKNNVMGSDVFRQQLGILFIERGMKLLKNNGILAIVLPNGYLTNPSESYLREWLLKNYRILGVIDLPAGTFKKSGTGVSPVLLFVENRKSLTDYKIFTAVAHAVGFNFRSKLNEKMYKRNPETGVYFTNSKGELIPENDLVKISFEFKNFAFEEHIQKMNCENSGLSYDFIMKSDLQRDPYLVLAPKRREKNYLQLINSLNSRGAKTLKQIGAKIVKKQDKIDETKEYYYLDISQIGAGKYVLENKIYGWNLPGRAKQLAKIGDIFVSRLNGSSSKFCIIVDDIDNIIVTNGMFKLIFKDEKQKFNFFHFLSTAEFSIQFNALATGSIMEDVKDVDLENMLLIPQSNIEENHLIIKRFLSLVLETNNLLK